MKLNLIQHITVFFWFIFTFHKYVQYLQYLHIGLQPKYAFEKVYKDV